MPWSPEGQGLGMIAGITLGAGIAATPSMVSCLSNPVCGTELVGGIAEEVAMLSPGTLSAGVTIAGASVKVGERVVGELIDDGVDVVFRGTTSGFPGSRGTQITGVTPTSSDPLVAVCYAQNACATFGGDGVIQVVDPRIADDTYPGLLTHDFEISLNGVTPSEVAASAMNVISVEEAAGALRKIGIDVPTSTGANGLSAVLQELQSNGTTPLTTSQIQQFLEITGSN